jgi:hypothetical protein
VCQISDGDNRDQIHTVEILGECNVLKACCIRIYWLAYESALFFILFTFVSLLSFIESVFWNREFSQWLKRGLFQLTDSLEGDRRIEITLMALIRKGEILPELT